jgi:hypothetical protein
MNGKSMLNRLAMLGVAVMLVAGNPAAVMADGHDQGQRVAGPYVALLDLGALGEPRIEKLFVILDDNGSVLFASEHEADKESTSVGAWERMGGGMIGLGAAGFRYGPDPASSICAFVGVDSPPGNCVLKVGGTVAPQTGGGFAGELFLTIESVDGGTVLTLPPPLPISMERLGLGDFPGATP